MSYPSIKGTAESIFHLDGPLGPMFKDNAEAIEARTFDDSAFAILRAAQPVGPNDVATLSTVGALTYAFVYRPGGVADGNVYIDWTSLMTAMGAVAGPRLLEVDGSLVGGTAHVPAGAWNLNDMTLTSTNGTDILNFDNGATIVAQQWSVTNALGVTHSSAAPIWTVATFEDLLTLTDSALVYSTSAVAFVHILNGGFLEYTGTVNAGVGDFTHAAVSVDAGGTFFAFLASAGAVNPNAVAGAGSFQASVDPDAFLGTPQGISPTTTLRGKGSQVHYTATAGVWAGAAPTNEQDAITRLANLAKTLNGGVPIP
jgi:hypothetical protein